METEAIKRLFTADEYHRMCEVGILDPKARLELIEGEIIEMSPPGTRHMACVNRANELLVVRLAGRAMVSAQNPLLLSKYTEPQPDLVVARPRADFYSHQRLSSEHTLLAIEVSDTSLSFDRKRKVPLYAAAGVPEPRIFLDGFVRIVNFHFPAPYPHPNEKPGASAGLTH